MSASADPVDNAVAVTKSDSTVLAPVPRAIYVGGGGDVVVTMAGGETSITFKAVPTGTILPIRPTKVLAATSATDILALY